MHEKDLFRTRLMVDVYYIPRDGKPKSAKIVHAV